MTTLHHRVKGAMRDHRHESSALHRPRVSPRPARRDPGLWQNESSMNKQLAQSLAVGLLAISPAFAAAEEGATGWLPWLVLGAVALVVGGIALRMIFAARFPAGYKAWAARKRDAFSSRNEAWDREDEEFRK